MKNPHRLHFHIFRRVPPMNNEQRQIGMPTIMPMTVRLMTTPMVKTINAIASPAQFPLLITVLRIFPPQC